MFYYSDCPVNLYFSYAFFTIIYISFLIYNFSFFHEIFLFKKIHNCLSKYFCNKCFKIFVRQLQHLIHIGVGIYRLSFIIHAVIFLVLSVNEWYSISIIYTIDFDYVLNILDIITLILIWWFLAGHPYGELSHNCLVDVCIQLPFKPYQLHFIKSGLLIHTAS